MTKEEAKQKAIAYTEKHNLKKSTLYVIRYRFLHGWKPKKEANNEARNKAIEYIEKKGIKKTRDNIYQYTHKFKSGWQPKVKKKKNRKKNLAKMFYKLKEGNK